jgi:hypothetical protein
LVLISVRTSPYESLDGQSALQIARRQMKMDIVDVLTNLKLEFDKQSEYELLQVSVQLLGFLLLLLLLLLLRF